MEIEQTISELKELLNEKKFSKEAVASMTDTFSQAIKQRRAHCATNHDFRAISDISKYSQPHICLQIWLIECSKNYSTVTDFARFLGLSTSVPLDKAT